MAETPTARMIAEQKAKAAKDKRKNKSDPTSNIRNYISQEEDRLNQELASSDLIKGMEWRQKEIDAGRGNLAEHLHAQNIAKGQRADLEREYAGKKSRLNELLQGAEFGKAVLGEEGLGRLSEDIDVQEVLQRYKDISEKGLDSGQLAMKKADVYKNIDTQGEDARRSLQAALARAGVKGGMAGQQLSSTLMDTASKKADVTRDLFLESAAAQRQGLADYSNRLGQVKTFDLAQEADEKNLILQAGFGTAQIGSSERSAKYAAEQARFAAEAKASAAPSCFRAGTRIDGKPIESIKVGDIIGNDMVTGVLTLKQNEPFYKYKGIYVTGSHYIYHDEEWKRVKDVPSAINTGLNDGVCYSLRTLTGTIMINDELFGDYDGFSDDETENFIIEKMNGEKLN